MFEIAIIILLIMGISIMITTFIFSHSFQKKLLDKIVVKGMNGTAGQNITLTCPPKMVISFENKNSNLTRGAIVALGDPTCDAFFQPGVGQRGSFFNPTTTVDALAPGSPFTDLTGCEGKNSCTFTVPNYSDSRLPDGCLKKQGQKLAFIGTFDCVAAK